MSLSSSNLKVQESITQMHDDKFIVAAWYLIVHILKTFDECSDYLLTISSTMSSIIAGISMSHSLYESKSLTTNIVQLLQNVFMPRI